MRHMFLSEPTIASLYFEIRKRQQSSLVDISKFAILICSSILVSISLSKLKHYNHILVILNIRYHILNIFMK